jgi:hypothetical protein
MASRYTVFDPVARNTDRCRPNIVKTGMEQTSEAINISLNTGSPRRYPGSAAIAIWAAATMQKTSNAARITRFTLRGQR